MRPDTWLALTIGNSRSHWAQFADNTLVKSWHAPELTATDALPFPYQGNGQEAAIELWIASVVPAQSDRWRAYPGAHFLTLADVPLHDTYPTLGIDRALAVWGAIVQVGAPVLVIDAGTALTFTGADAKHRLVGGAILPGLRLQFQSLGKTAALPDISLLDSANQLPSRWAKETEGAIASGILYTLLAGIEAFITDWWQQYPGSAVVLTGGNRELLQRTLQQTAPVMASQIAVNPLLIFAGIEAIRSQQKVV